MTGAVSRVELGRPGTKRQASCPEVHKSLPSSAAQRRALGETRRDPACAAPATREPHDERSVAARATEDGAQSWVPRPSPPRPRPRPRPPAWSPGPRSVPAVPSPAVPCSSAPGSRWSARSAAQSLRGGAAGGGAAGRTGAGLSRAGPAGIPEQGQGRRLADERSRARRHSKSHGRAQPHLPDPCPAPLPRPVPRPRAPVRLKAQSVPRPSKGCAKQERPVAAGWRSAWMMQALGRMKAMNPTFLGDQGIGESGNRARNQNRLGTCGKRGALPESCAT